MVVSVFRICTHDKRPLSLFCMKMNNAGIPTSVQVKVDSAHNSVDLVSAAVWDTFTVSVSVENVAMVVSVFRICTHAKRPLSLFCMKMNNAGIPTSVEVKVDFAHNSVDLVSAAAWDTSTVSVNVKNVVPLVLVFRTCTHAKRPPPPRPLPLVHHQLFCMKMNNAGIPTSVQVKVDSAHNSVDLVSAAVWDTFTVSVNVKNVVPVVLVFRTCTHAKKLLEPSLDKHTVLSIIWVLSGDSTIMCQALG